LQGSLALAVVLYVVVVYLGAWWAGTPDQALGRLASAPLYREFAGIFLAGFAGTLVAREFHVRSCSERVSSTASCSLPRKGRRGSPTLSCGAISDPS
jgi:hypothetical protein